MSARLAGLVAVAICLACIPAAIGRAKGRSFLGFWLFGFVLWLPAVIVALIMKSDEDALARRYTRHPGRAEGWRELGAPEFGSESRRGIDKPQTTDVEMLARLAELRDRGVLTDEEFATQKQRYLRL